MSDSSDTYTPIDYGIDASPEEILGVADNPDSIGGRAAIIRTSDRILFKRCRRRWGWNSHLKQNLGPKQTADPLWLGTGIHYAMEDFHGYNKFGSPVKAFQAYCEANFKLRQRYALPPGYEDLKVLGEGMLAYYANEWLADRDPLKTLWVDGAPQVELRVLLKVPFNPRDMYPDSPYSEVYYSLTIDRVVEDDDGELWLLDYKTAKQFSILHFASDPQIGAYYWAGNHVFQGRKIAGFIYQQHRKTLPDLPRFTAAGRLSTDQRQLVTHRAYRNAIISIYSADIQRWPAANLEMLNNLAEQETPDSDRFIRRDRIHRNEYNFESEGSKILLELEDMLNPDLPLYPNPTRDCTHMCSFHHACVSMDDGSDFVEELRMLTAPRPPQQDDWRNYLEAVG